ncbi:hypothetical protein [Rubrimonas cliftonensis]|uniref:Uncharacterized protein n=1 Tax=Rubrimonas cliftonensis TaxID=89524 RepID=A0A1H3VR24_9RHOB|nr:hypothetical protein [Rubrimonas cliftonensis]SDZ77253.1 hypothetical protein SAMN05444370_101274 [Rubrimonas cliftonensis]
MRAHPGKIFNERLKAIAAALNTLSSAVLVLGVIKRNIDGAQTSLASGAAELDLLWIAVAFVGYALGLWLLGWLKPEA